MTTRKPSYGKPNRVQAQRPHRKQRWWCHRCDGQLVTYWKSCYRCGAKERDHKKIKGAQASSKGSRVSSVGCV